LREVEREKVLEEKKRVLKREEQGVQEEGRESRDWR